MKENYEILFIKFLNDGVTPAEYAALEEWFLRSDDNQKTAIDLYRTHFAIETEKALRQIDLPGALRKNAVLRSRRRNRLARIRIAAAASVALLIAAGFLIFRTPETHYAFDLTAVPANPNGEVNLILSDDRVLALEGDEPALQYDDRGRIMAGAQVIDEAHEPQTEPVMHQLVVPKGKRSSITLPDGTRAWVNSDSRLIYPSTLEKKREIFVEGEVYLEVAHDKSKPFTVRTRNFDVEVVGTSFNIFAYGESNSQSITLVEGAVVVSSGENMRNKLTPNEMLTFDNGEISVRSVDPADHISWITGVYRFRSEALQNIADRLMRYYGTPIVIPDPDISAIRCSGKLELKDSPSNVYQSLAQAASVEYTDHGTHIEFRARDLRDPRKNP